MGRRLSIKLPPQPILQGEPEATFTHEDSREISRGCIHQTKYQIELNKVLLELIKVYWSCHATNPPAFVNQILSGSCHPI